MSIPITHIVPHIEACGVCASTNLNDLRHIPSHASIICKDCGAHWWKSWYSKSEWDKLIDDERTAWMEDESPD
jgi:hypothetical protein